MTVDKPHGTKRLLDTTDVVPYDAFVTDDQFWLAVGEALQRRRLRLGLKSTNAVQTAGGPTYKTTAAIESGRVGEIESLRLYAKAVNVSIVDLFRSILAVDDRTLTPELQEVIRKFEVTTADGRVAIHATARAVPERPRVEETPDDRHGLHASKTSARGEVLKRREKK